MGELIEAVPPQPGKRTDRQPSGGAPTRSQIADAAGISKDQQVTAMRVHSVPRDEFERQVESEDPPTVSKKAGVEFLDGGQGVRLKPPKTKGKPK